MRTGLLRGLGRGASFLRLGTLLAVGAVFLWWLRAADDGADRTILLELRTTALELAFAEGAGRWKATWATICRLDPEAVPAGDGDAECGGSSLYVPDPPGGRRDVDFVWTPGAVLRAEVSPAGTLVLQVEDGEIGLDARTGAAPLTSGARILVGAQDWRGSGALTFAARMRAGSVMAAGQDTLVLGGRWEARQTDPLTAWVRGQDAETDVVKSGEIVRGSRLSVAGAPLPDGSGRGEVPVYGHLTPGADEAGAYMEVVALSRPGATGLLTAHFGGDRPKLIRPDPIDFVIASPFLLALAVIAQLLSALVQVYVDLTERRGTGRARGG